MIHTYRDSIKRKGKQKQLRGAAAAAVA
eukprot:COSAG06_NODE_7292_length_2555_cov_27.969055_1_plen_27_part_10